MRERVTLVVSVAVAVALLLPLAFLAGRWTAPKPPAEVRTVEREVVRYRAYEAHVWRMAEQRTEKRDVRVVTRWSPPKGCDGVTVERIEEDRSARVENVATTSEGARWTSETGAIESRAETKASTLPRFALTVGPAWTLPRDFGRSFRPSGVAASVGIRAFGPLWITAMGTRAGGETSAALMAGVQW